MIKKFLLIVVVAISFVNCGNTQSLSTMGQHTFAALRASKSYSTFAQYFVTANDCREIALQATESAAYNELNSLADALDEGQVFENRVYRLWSTINTLGKHFGIDWSKIEYVDWFYRTKNKMGINGGIGTLVFKYNGKYFMISPTMYKVNNTYKLAYWGNSFEKILEAIFSSNLIATYQNGQYCLSDGSQKVCYSIAQELNEMDF